MPNSSPPRERRIDYRAMLRRLCDRAELGPTARESILSREMLSLAGIPITLQLEEWSSFVKVFAAVGPPQPERAADVYRHLLEQHLALPAPFSLVAGLDAETDSIVLYGFAPLPMTPEADENFLAFLQGCALAAANLRGEAPTSIDQITAV